MICVHLDWRPIDLNFDAAFEFDLRACNLALDEMGATCLVYKYGPILALRHS